ncbi:hypothetical protein BDP27DRAFT_1250271, partial [Rhodocollybia butyracea]
IELVFNAILDFVSDITTTIALSWTFKGMNSGIKQTETLLNKLFQYTVTRGIFVTLNQLAFLILYLVNAKKLWWMPFHLCITKIYVITMGMSCALFNCSKGSLTLLLSCNPELSRLPSK